MDIIIGAGVSGISYANFTEHPFLLFESEKEIGGYCRTIKKNGFIWDYSGHFFHFRNPEIKEFVCRNIDKSQLVNIAKHTQIFYDGKYIDFPFQANIHQLPKNEFIDCLYDLLFADSDKEATSFKDYVYNNYGKAISEKFLIPYNEKLYATDLDTLDPDAMGRFFPKADKWSIVRNFKNNDSKSYNDTFTYPKGGAIEYVKSISANIASQNILTKSKVIKVDICNKRVFLENGNSFQFDNLISTIPFPKLLDLCSIQYDKSIYTSNKVLVYNLGFDKDSIDKKNSWVYFPDKKICFYRIGYYNNILQQNRMSLYVEIGFNSDCEIPDKEILLEKVLSDLRNIGIITEHKLVDYNVILMDPAYVHINKRHLNDIESKKSFLKEKNIYSIGRYGSWTYCSIEDNIIEAMELANLLNIK